MRIFILGAVLLCVSLIANGTVRANDAPFHESFDGLDSGKWYTSNGWANGDYQSCEWRAENITAAKGDLIMTLSDHSGKVRPIGCAETRTTRRFGYGLYEARMRTAKGSGLNTAFFTYIGPPNGVAEWDEIDFEFLGKDSHTVQVNNYTNGKSPGGAIIQLGFDASASLHDYAIDWQATKIKWYVDGKLVHETPDGTPIPRNPGSLFLSLWSGATQMDGWLGPFQYQAPVTAEVSWTAYTPNGINCAFPESMTCK